MSAAAVLIKEETAITASTVKTKATELNGAPERSLSFEAFGPVCLPLAPVEAPPTKAPPLVKPGRTKPAPSTPVREKPAEKPGPFTSPPWHAPGEKSKPMG